MCAKRNLYNGDFGSMFWNAEQWQQSGNRFSADGVRCFVDTLADNGVDTLIINPNTRVAWYPSKAVPTILDRYVRDDPEFFRHVETLHNSWFTPSFINPFLDLAEAGVNWLSEAIAACRDRRVSPWVSVRMNDPHVGRDPLDPMNAPLLLDPQLSLGEKGDCLDCRYPMGTYGLNYARAEVRDYMFTMIRELVEDYDIDGLQLDWLRIPACCPLGASVDDLSTMNDWFGSIRALVDKKAGATGRSAMMAMRVPGNYRMLKHIGIDIAHLVAEQVVNALFPSNFWHTAWDMPLDRIREDLGPEVELYGVTEGGFSCLWALAADNLDDRFNCSSAPALRANAAGKLVLGAAGIEQFNFFIADQVRKYRGLPVYSDYHALRGLTDLESLRGQEKHYALQTIGRNCWVPPFDLPDSFPIALGSGWRHSLRIPMCAEPTNQGLELVIQVILPASADSADIGVSFNGGWPSFDRTRTTELFFPTECHTHHLPVHVAFNYRFSVEDIREGWNEIAILSGTAVERQENWICGSNSVTVVGMELAVRIAQ